MTINLEQIYAGLKAWRDERGITAKSQDDSSLFDDEPLKDCFCKF